MSIQTSNRYQIEDQTADYGRKLLRLVDHDAGLRFTVAPFAGAEIAGIQFRQGDRWLEILDRAEDFSPCDRWKGRAPWLWPAVGRSYSARVLENLQREAKSPPEFGWDFEGKSYPMPVHGFAMHREWSVKDCRADSQGAYVECSLSDDAKTREFYPFGFQLNLSFGLAEGTVRAVFQVRSSHLNRSVMPLCFGNHITLRAPLTKDGSFEDVRVFAPVRRLFAVTESGLVGESRELSFREGPPLRDGRLHNCIVGRFAPDQAAIRVVDPCGLQVEVEQREVSEHSTVRAPQDGFYFVFYALPKEGFFCPEPWLGLPNSLNTRRPVVELPPGGTFAWEMTVRMGRS